LTLDVMAHVDENELITAGIASLADARGLSPERLAGGLVATRASCPASPQA
jgi:hypothetical protein